MRYLPHTDSDIAAMLERVGAGSLDELFSGVPPNCRMGEDLELPEPLTEWELTEHLESLAARNASSPKHAVFLGAGSYEHHVPSIVPYLVGRSEFLTAYTPYQPEISQGTLQAIFEYQTMVARLTGMEVANASVYDGATALIEGLLLGIRATRKGRVAVSRAVHPNYRRVVQTYLASAGYEMVEIPYGADGRTNLGALEGGDDLAAVALQSPNFFGCVEDLDAGRQAADGIGALLVATFTEALAYGLLKPPGSFGADVACGEGQSLGISQSFGGPYLGVFAARKKYVRNMPGRLIGRTVDRQGRDGFVLTLATREQHIRREKATSNICSNQSLCALTAAIYLATLGKTGIRHVARLNYDKTEYLKGKLRQAGLKLRFDGPTFNEFVLELPEGGRKRYDQLLGQNIVAGLPLEPHYGDLENCYLLCVTETRTREQMDALVRGLSS